jgi:hypothetical protein
MAYSQKAGENTPKAPTIVKAPMLRYIVVCHKAYISSITMVGAFGVFSPAFWLAIRKLEKIHQSTCLCLVRKTFHGYLKAYDYFQ